MNYFLQTWSLLKESPKIFSNVLPTASDATKPLICSSHCHLQFFIHLLDSRQSVAKCYFNLVIWFIYESVRPAQTASLYVCDLFWCRWRHPSTVMDRSVCKGQTHCRTRWGCRSSTLLSACFGETLCSSSCFHMMCQFHISCCFSAADYWNKTAVALLNQRDYGITLLDLNRL